MPAIETVKTAAATSTEMSDTQLNPALNAPTNVNVHVTLRFHDVTFTPSALYTALDNAYGTVATSEDQHTRNTYIFDISA